MTIVSLSKQYLYARITTPYRTQRKGILTCRVWFDYILALLGTQNFAAPRRGFRNQQKHRPGGPDHGVSPGEVGGWANERFGQMPKLLGGIEVANGRCNLLRA